MTTVVRQVVTAAKVQASVVIRAVIPSVEAVEVCPLTQAVEAVEAVEVRHLQLGQGPAAVTVQQQEY